VYTFQFIKFYLLNVKKRRLFKDITAGNKRFERKAGKVLRLNIFGKKKVLSSCQHLSVKSALRQAAKTLAVIVNDNPMKLIFLKFAFP